MAIIDRNVSELRSLNLGCGTDIRIECVNVDIAPLAGVDVVHNLAVLPLPFAAERFECVVCRDVLEHVDVVAMLREVHRLLVPGGIVDIRVPHFSSPNAYGDPTHIRAFSIETFDFFCADGPRPYYFDFAFSAIQSRRITFSKGRSYAFNSLIEPLVNLSNKTQRYYEHSPLRIFPPLDIEIRLKK